MRRARHASRSRRAHKGGNYATDITRFELEGEPIRPPNEVVITTSGGEVMSVAAFLRKQDNAILHGHSSF